MGSWKGTKHALCFTFGLLVCMQLVAAQDTSIQVNNDNDETHFQGQVFRRLCSIHSSSDTMPVFEWLRDGVTLSSGIGVNLQLHLSSVELNHTGHYTCRVTLDDGSVLGPISGGSLTVLDRTPIYAPTTQYIIYGSTTTLNCSYPDAYPTWKRNNSVISNSIREASIAHEGEYSCDLFVPSSSASVLINITVHVIVPVNITTKPRSFQEILGNVPKTFEVQFNGRREQNLTVTWFRNGSRLPTEVENRIVTAYDRLSGRTSLIFPQITRADQGVYRVVVMSLVGLGAVGESLTTAETSFQVDIIVPPLTPTNFRVDSITSLTADITWTLTNQTADEGGDVLILRVTFANMTLATDLIRLPGGQTEFRLEDLIPGTDYTATLSAENEDGVVSTPMKRLTTLIGVPKVNELLIERVNETFFVATVSLAYTGGGVVSHFEISYKTVAPISWNELPDTLVSSSSSTSLVWSGLFEVPYEDVSLGVLDFQLRVVNQYGLKSPYNLNRATMFVQPTTTLVVTTAGPVKSSSPLPLWAIVAIVAVISVVSTIALMTCVICMGYQCKRRQRIKRQYQVNNPTSNLNNSMEKELDADNSMISRQTTQDRNMMMSSRAQSSSTSSLSKKSVTPIPSSSDEKYFKAHRRSPSEASSIIAKQTPSTTASSSPANMKAQYKTQMQNDSLQDLPESLSIHELQRQADAAESQCSQTESENVQIQNRHNLEMSYSMHDNVPGASLPSSVQSSHQSLPSGVSITINHTNLVNGASHQSLPIASGNTMLDGGYHPLHSSSQRIVMRPPGAGTDGHTEVGITQINMPGSHSTAGGSGVNFYYFK